MRRGLRALHLGHCGEVEAQVLTLALGAAMMLRHDFQGLCLGTAMMLRRGFQDLCLDHCNDVEMRVSTLASWCCASGYD